MGAAEDHCTPAQCPKLNGLTMPTVDEDAE